jgi:cytochrome bd-type quinol oxidase subunit 2
MALQSFTGFSYLTPMALTNCSNTYYTTKYDSFSRKLLNIFIPACLGMFLQLAHCIMLILPLIKHENPSSQRLKTSYILAALNTLAGIIVFGHILSFQMDFNLMKNCETIFIQTLLTSLLAISAAVMLVAIIQSFMSIFANFALE